MSSHPPEYISSEYPSIVSKTCGIRDQAALTTPSTTHPLVPTVPKVVHGDIKAYTERKCSSKNGSNEDAWMSAIELHTTHEPREGRSRTVALDNGVVKSVGKLEGITVSVVLTLCIHFRPTAMIFVRSEVSR